VLPAKRWSFSLFRSAFDERQGLTDVGDFGITAAYGIGDRVEVFANWRLIRISRNLNNPTFVPTDPVYGGVAQENPYVRHSWSKDVGGPVQVGAKWALISQSRGDALSLAPRVLLQFPASNTWSSTGDYVGRIELVGSREFGKVFEATGTASAIIRGDPDEFRLSDGVGWGVGATFPSRSRLRAMVEWTGEYVINQYVETTRPFFADDGSVAPKFSKLNDPSYLKIGGVYQATPGWFIHAGANYSQGIGDRMVGGKLAKQTAWELEASIGWHPGVKVYVPPPPPAPEVREVVREVPAPAPPAPAPNRNPTFSVIATCNPPVIEPGQTSNCTATATDPDGDPVTYRWTAPQGTFNNPNAQNTVWTAPGQTGNVPITVTASDNRGGTATSTVVVQVVRRQTLMFEDVHFDFDKYNLRPDALQILDRATAALMQNPDVRITIEGHCDSIGTVEYNLALGERRANSVRDYLVNRGIMNQRLRTVSYGEERPIADNNTAQGRAMNRRAALVVIIETP
jgi:peptidoglycan-associated lipoprotein